VTEGTGTPGGPAPGPWCGGRGRCSTPEVLRGFPYDAEIEDCGTDDAADQPPTGYADRAN